MSKILTNYCATYCGISEIQLSLLLARARHNMWHVYDVRMTYTMDLRLFTDLRAKLLSMYGKNKTFLQLMYHKFIAPSLRVEWSIKFFLAANFELDESKT